MIFGSPLLAASSTHSSEYPLPLKITFLWFLTISVNIAWISPFKSLAFSSLSAISDKVSATIVFNTKLHPEIVAEDGTF